MADRTSSNVERNPYANQGGSGMVVDEEEIEVILPMDEDEGLQGFLEVVEEITYDHNENIVGQLDQDDLDEIATKVIDGFEADKESRGEWVATFEKGFDLLGLKLRETSEPFEGACTAVHPLLIESAVKFQSKATQELFPSKGPVKTQILGNPTIEKDRQANRVMNFMNYQLTDQMPEYFSELERMLFNLPVFGSAFKKTYWDMSFERPMSEFVPIDQFYVSNFASDLQNAERYTHVVYRSPNDLKRDIEAGMYCIDHYDDEGLPKATPVEPTPIKSKMDMILGITPNYDEEPQYTILEQHCYLEIEEEVDDDDNAMTVALPYIVSVDEHSRKVLCIRRNWKEDDPRKEKLLWFTHYRFVPGFGFYGLGFIHFLGNLTATATSAVRNLVDAGQFATLPGGFKARGVRIVGSNDAIAPGEFKEVEATGIDLTKSIIPLPYKEPSQTLMSMLQFVTAAGQKFADATEQVISDSTNYGPVGTTLALLEASTKFFSAIHKRLHYSQRQELRILARINHEFLPDEYPYDIANVEGQIFKSDFDGRIDIIPVSDPNVPSSSHRLAIAQTVMQMAQQAPQGMYNLREINRVMLDAAGIENPDQFLIPEQKAEPRDPISDINAASQGMPIKAFPGQDHQAHITVKQAFIADPTLGQNPIMQALVPILQANIREHMIMQYEEQMTGMLTQGIEQAGVGSPEAISQITQGAAQEILQNNQRMAEQGSVEDLEKMTLELQRQQLELEREKVKIDAAQKAADIAIQEEKLDLEKDKIEINAAEKLAKIKGVARDREIVSESKSADRDDKFLIEMMKLLVKETGTTVEKMKEEVVLRPENFQEGGDTIFGMIGSAANQLGMSLSDIISSIFGGPPPDPVMTEDDDELSTDEWLELNKEYINKEPDEFSEVKEKEEFKYKAPVTHEVETAPLPDLPVYTGTGPFNKGLDLNPTKTMENIPKALKSMQDRLDTAPLIEEKKEETDVDGDGLLEKTIEKVTSLIPSIAGSANAGDTETAMAKSPKNLEDLSVPLDADLTGPLKERKKFETAPRKPKRVKTPTYNFTASPLASVLEKQVIASIESTNNPQAIRKNKEGKYNKNSPRGLFQFKFSTAKELMPELKSPDQLLDPKISEQLFDLYSAKHAPLLNKFFNGSEMKKLYGDREVDITDIYLAHQQGLGGYKEILQFPNRKLKDMKNPTRKRNLMGNLSPITKERIKRKESPTINDWINDWKLLFQNRRDSMSQEITQKQEDIIKSTV